MHRRIESFPLTLADNKFFHFSEHCDCPYQQARLTISVFLWTRLAPAPWDGNEALPAGPLTASCCVASSLLAPHSKNKEVGGLRPFDPVPPVHPYQLCFQKVQA